MKSRKRFRCLDCDEDTGKLKEYYMLRDEVWNLIHGSEYGMLCVGCAEIRLGRELTESDFNDSYVNTVNFAPKSQRLMSRLGGKNEV